FQAEDGIRDPLVTGVQTCALPIFEKDATYTLVVSDFMATGGSGFGMLSSSPREDIDVVDLDALIRYLGVLPAPAEAPVEERFHRSEERRVGKEGRVGTGEVMSEAA